MGAADSGRERGNQEETVEAAMSVKGEEAERRGDRMGWQQAARFGNEIWGLGPRRRRALDGRKRRRGAGREEDLWGSAALPCEVSATTEVGGSVLTKCF